MADRSQGVLLHVGIGANKEFAIIAEQTRHRHVPTVFPMVGYNPSLKSDSPALNAPDAENFDCIVIEQVFRHLAGDKDTQLIKDIHRLLAAGGKAYISQIYLSPKYLEVWNKKPLAHFDPKSEVFIDETATFAGHPGHGEFARVYSPEAFFERIIKTAQTLGLRAHLLRCQIDGQDQPDLKTNYSASLRRPFRILCLEK